MKNLKTDTEETGENKETSNNLKILTNSRKLKFYSTLKTTCHRSEAEATM